MAEPLDPKNNVGDVLGDTVGVPVSETVGVIVGVRVLGGVGVVVGVGVCSQSSSTLGHFFTSKFPFSSRSK
ncbi:MAG: hypothetical protein N2654_00560, partial [Deltaproteobacteria bacterium]|nr:hypothetical protein [Deltaproteobacteria bacterium]